MQQALTPKSLVDSGVVCLSETLVRPWMRLALICPRPVMLIKVPHESLITSLKKGLTRFSVNPFDERVSTACRGNA